MTEMSPEQAAEMAEKYNLCTCGREQTYCDHGSDCRRRNPLCDCCYPQCDEVDGEIVKCVACGQNCACTGCVVDRQLQDEEPRDPGDPDDAT
jgi:hypothetical protein